MSLRKKISYGIFAVLLLVGAAAASGGYSGGGGDRVRNFVDDSAWFYGSNKLIRTCAVVAPGFGKAEAELRDTVKTAFATWQAYINQKHVQLGRSQIDLTTSIEQMPACDGTEDLKLYFGMSDASVEEGRKHFINPVAFAYRTAYDEQKMWGKGLIWLAPNKSLGANYPDWNVQNTTLGILLHEVGHVMGCDHVPGTIMDEAISAMLDSFGNPNCRAQIDITRELYHCEDCTLDWKGEGAIQNTDGHFNASKKLVTAVVGHDVADVGDARIAKAPSGQDYVLELTAYKGPSLGKFTIHVTGNTPIESAQVFRHAFGPWRNSKMNIIYGSLTAADGSSIPVVLEMNVLGRLLTVYGMLDGVRAELAEFRIEIPPFTL